MSTKINAVVVTFREDVSEEKAKAICEAMLLIDGVINASPNETSLDTHVAISRVRHELTMDLLELIRKKKK